MGIATAAPGGSSNPGAGSSAPAPFTSARLSEAMKAPESTTPAPDSTTAPPAETAPASPEPVAAPSTTDALPSSTQPASTAPGPSGAPALDLTQFPSAVQTLIQEKYNGDVAAALASLVPAAQPEIAPSVSEPEPDFTAELPPAHASPQEILDITKSVLDRDPDVRAMVAKYNDLAPKLQQTRDAIAALPAKIAKLEGQLELPMVQADEFLKRDISQQIANLKAEETRLGGLELQYEAKLEREEAKYNAKAESVRSDITSRVDTSLGARRQAATDQLRLAHYTKVFARDWPIAVDRAITQHKIPAAQLKDFRTQAKNAAYISEEDIDPFKFADGFARDYMERYDSYHRAKSAEYARLKTDATANPVAPSTPGAVAPSESPTPLSITDLVANRKNALKQGFRNLRSS
jgi:hypothetical protein